MAKFDIISSRDGSVLYNGAPKYQGAYLRPSYLEFQSIGSPEPIHWRVGDYIFYSRLNMTFKLYSIPKVTKQSLAQHYGGAFLYENVQFFSDAKQLDICPFSDTVPGDNRIHFSTQETFSFIGSPSDVADRIDACLQDMFPGQWTVRMATGLSPEYLEEKEFSASGLTVLGALDRIYDTWPGLGWVHTVEGGRNVLTIGGANVRSAANTTDPYSYDHGLSRLSRSVGNMAELTTRLYGYGSMRNMPAGYYKGKQIKDAESVDIQHLMIPISSWGTTGGLPDPSKAYVENAAAVNKYGLIPRKVYFDGSNPNYPEIYPSIEGLTAARVRSGKAATGDTSYIPSPLIWPADQRVDILVAGSSVIDEGESAADGNRYVEISEIAVDVEQQVRITEDVVGIEPSIIVATYSTIYDENSTASFVNDVRGTVTLVTGNHAPEVYLYLCFKDPTNLAIWSHADSSVEVALETDEEEPGVWRFTLPRISGNYESSEGIWLVLGVSQGQVLEDVEEGESSFAVTLEGIATAKIALNLPETFTVIIPQIGFNIENQAVIDEGATISMKSGKCAGRDFRVDSCKYDEDTDTWEVTLWRSFDEDLSTWFPNWDYQLEAGDRYVILDIAMPELYINAQSERLLEGVQKLLDDASQEKPFYEPEIDSAYVNDNLLYLREGLFMHLVNDEVVDGGEDYALIDTLEIDESAYDIPVYRVNLRMRKATGWTTASGASTGRVSNSIQTDAYLDAIARESRRLARHSFMNALETARMLANAQLEGFEKEIKPIFVQTMQMLVGDESLQFRFILGFNNPNVAPDPVYYDPDTKQVTFDHTYLQHMTLGITDVTAERDLSEYLIWEMQGRTSAVLANPEQSYYVYAKVDALNDGTSHRTGEFVMSETSIAMRRDLVITDGEITGGYYHLLMGMLNSEMDGDRVFAPMYGFTWILPGQITTELLRSSDGLAYFDLARRIFQLGDKLRYDPTNGLVINNGLTVSGSGQPVAIGAWCGEYNSNRTYKLGDEVWWQAADGTISTYRYKYDTSSSGHLPSDSTYWQFSAKGVKGADGSPGSPGSPGVGIVSVVETGWNPNGLNSTTVPTTGWTRPPASKPAQVLGRYYWTETTTTYSDNSTTVIYTPIWCATNGNTGAQGIPGPASPYRGEYNKDEEGNAVVQTYYATSKRCDVVYYVRNGTGKFYQAIYNGTDRTFSNIDPTNAEYWTSFGVNFQNIATGLLFAAEAIVDKLGVRILETNTEDSGEPRIYAHRDVMSMYDSNGDEKLRISGGTLSDARQPHSTTIGSTAAGRKINTTSSALSNPDFVNGVVRESNCTPVSFTVGKGASIVFPQVAINLGLKLNNVSSGPSTNVAFELIGGWLLDGVKIDSDFEGAVLDPSTTNYTNTTAQGSGGGLVLSGFTLPVSEGTHTIALWGRIEAGGDLTCGSWEHTMDLSSAATLTAVYAGQLTEVAADGFQVRFGSYEMFRCGKDSNNVITMLMRSNNCGIEVSSGNHVKILDNGTWYELGIDNGFVKATQVVNP